MKSLGVPLNTVVGSPAAVGTETSNLRRNAKSQFSSDQRSSPLLAFVPLCYYRMARALWP